MASDSIAKAEINRRPAQHKVGDGKSSGSPHQAADAHAKDPGGDDPARKAYKSAQAAYQSELGQYWNGVEASKHANHKVTQFPPFYKGPEKPPHYDPPKEPSTLPSVNDMLHAWRIVAPIASGNPKLPNLNIDETSEGEFKRNYAREALNVGKKYCLNKTDTQNIVESIYAFEDAGKGTFDTLSGVPFKLTAPDPPGSHVNENERRKIHPLSTAIGYNQLLTATTLQFVEGSHAVNARLDELAKAEPARAHVIAAKAHVLSEVQTLVHHEMLKFAQKDRGKYLDSHGQPTYPLYADFARSSDITGTGLTGRQLSSAVQAMNLDRDIGPVLQAQELEELFGHGLNSAFKGLLEQKSKDDSAAARAYEDLSIKDKDAAVRELMERIAPVPAKQPGGAPTSASADGTRGTASRDVLAENLRAFGTNENTPLTKESLGPEAYALLTGKVLSLKKLGEVGGPLRPATRVLVDALFFKVSNQPSGDAYLPAAVELANLAGLTNADEMLKSTNAGYPTVNFFDRSGYQANGITNGRTADELVKAIYRSMHGANGSPQNYGMAEMIKAFDSI